MDFRISDSFTDSLSRLTGEEQKIVKTTVFDLQVNPANPGHQFHKLDKARDQRFWSVRVSSDLRIIVHRTESNMLLCYVAHHDEAYRWGECRKIEVHPNTGAAQLIEIRESVKEIIIPVYVQGEKKKQLLFENVPDQLLLGVGVPAEWLNDVKQADEDSIFKVAEHLPAEASEALLELAVGGKKPQPTTPVKPENPFSHPDAQRRFRLMENVEELKAALDFPWEKWILFLHPSQQSIVEQRAAGVFRVTGSAGTGKTIVALHRAVFLAKQNPNSRVLLTTFSDTLANALKSRLRRLIGNEPRLGERIEVHALDTFAIRLHESRIGKIKLISKEALNLIISDCAKKEHKPIFGIHFLVSEWSEVFDAWQISSLENYKDQLRLGRKSRLSDGQRKLLWDFFSDVRGEITKAGLVTISQVYGSLVSHLGTTKKIPFEHIVIDECQDLSVPQMRFLASLGEAGAENLFFAGDIGQRIFQSPFSWKALGIDIRGRSKVLKVNYRTSHQIRKEADRLLGPELIDMDGNAEKRNQTISVFNGPEPEVKLFDGQGAEISFVADWIKSLVSSGMLPHEIAIIVRSESELSRAGQAVSEAGLGHVTFGENVETSQGRISLCPMHLVKGLEFRAVAVMACDEDVIPSRKRLESAGEMSDMEEIFNTERQLLYVACTRARDGLLITTTRPGSEFLGDLSTQNVK